VIYCTDCHNNDEAGNQNGINGPHGSNYAPILRDRMVFTDGNNESSAIYALCYRCHDRDSILNDDDNFKHDKHIRNEDTSCTTCHDPHGSYNNTHLINFNTDYVSPNRDGQLEWVDLGTYSGACYLKCHGEDHHPEDY
ncbi:MAG: cytochrome c3 family protein, partial [Fidelibacterota bacterium]